MLPCSPHIPGGPADIGTKTVYAYVDIGGEVADESDISNNAYSTEVEVTAPAELSGRFFRVRGRRGYHSVTVGNAGGANATGVSIGLVYQSSFLPSS